MGYKLVLPPNQASYSVTDGVEVIRTELSGGRSRYRKDILGSTSQVNVSWTVNSRQFDYLRAFYKTVTYEGSRWFKIDLILDEPYPVEHEAMFIPGSISLSEQKYGLSTMTAQLDVIPIARDYSTDSLYIATVEEFGLDEWEFNVDLFHQLVLDLP